MLVWRSVSLNRLARAVLHLAASRHSPLLGDKAFAVESGLHSPLLLQPEFTYLERLSTESSVDDLGTCRGVVLRRAASILRSIETQPLTGRFVRTLSVGQPLLRPLYFTVPFPDVAARGQTPKV